MVEFGSNVTTSLLLYIFIIEIMFVSYTYICLLVCYGHDCLTLRDNEWKIGCSGEPWCLYRW